MTNWNLGKKVFHYFKMGEKMTLGQLPYLNLGDFYGGYPIVSALSLYIFPKIAFPWIGVGVTPNETLSFSGFYLRRFPEKISLAEKSHLGDPT